MNYYNEIEPYCAAWLRNLIDAGHIPAGDIDTRSIEDVSPNDVRGYTQCHWFAGIGGWPLALALAGWPASRPVWTGSCPCQPFSAAGKGAGFADERHLWPAWQHLIAQCRPAVVFGEQVASKAVDPWIDLVHADMEGMGYAFGGIAFPAAGVGAPHIRDRTYWVAKSNGEQSGVNSKAIQAGKLEPGRNCGFNGLHLSERVRLREPVSTIRRGITEHGLPHPQPQSASFARMPYSQWPDPTNGQWGSADWLGCTDGKWRPAEPGTFPLAHGIPGRVGRLRAYGNAIVPAQAAHFIAAYAEALGLIMPELEDAA